MAITEQAMDFIQAEVIWAEIPPEADIIKQRQYMKTQ